MILLSDLEDTMLLCAELGINDITTCEEAFYSWNSNPNLTKRIDEFSKIITAYNWQESTRHNNYYSEEIIFNNYAKTLKK